MNKRFNVGEVAEFFGFSYRVRSRTEKTVTFECVSHPTLAPRRYVVRTGPDGAEWVRSKGDIYPTYASEFAPE